MPFTENSERIAIVGIGGIFPGASDLDQFWHNIIHGIDTGRKVPEGRWYLSADKALAPWPPQPDRVYSTWGCFIEGFSFDPEGFNIAPSLLQQLDPMFHLGLHAARAACRDAGGLRGVAPERVGVILGNIALPTESTSAMCRDVLGRTLLEKLIDAAAAAASQRSQDSDGSRDTTAPAHLTDRDQICALKASLQRSDWHPLNQFAAGLPASLIAQGLGLGGIAFTLDAACASSLYSLKLASEELLAHRADAMLAGGMSRPDCQYTQMGFAQLQALSRQGRCAPLSSAADGLVVGEGAGIFVLKRLRDAIAAGDHIYGVIAGIGLSNDRGANLLAPHSEGQLRAMRDAYQQAGWKPSDVDLIECHATGTPVGDAVEIHSLHQLWEAESSRPRQCVIGGVKSNVGHLLTGAGAAGLMKVLFALKHCTLPPTANFVEPAAGLTSPDSPFQVLKRSAPWLRREPDSSSGQSTPRRATINAFGFGGINAHVLIEEWIATEASAVGSSPDPSPTAADVRSRMDGSEESISIVGIDACLGDLNSIEELRQRYRFGTTAGAVQFHWWGAENSDWIAREWLRQDGNPTKPSVGCGITNVDLPIGTFRIPPLEMQDMLPQQQLMLQAAAGAIQDAEPDENEASANPESVVRSNRTGVFIGIELDPNTTNFHFRWAIEQDAPAWATLLGLDLSPDEMSTWIRALKDSAGPPLTPNRVMGNLGGIVASRLAREFDVGGPSFTISCGGDSGRIACLLAVQFLQRNELDAAIVGGVDLASDVRTMVRGSMRPGRQTDENQPRDGAISLLLKRRQDARERGDRIYANLLAPVIPSVPRRGVADRTIPSFDDDRAFAALESLLKMTLATYHRYSGSAPRLRNRALPSAGPLSHLQFPEDAEPGFLVEPEYQPLTRKISVERFSQPGDPSVGLIVLSSGSPNGLLTDLRLLDEFEPSCVNPADMARRWHHRPGRRANDTILAAIVMTSRPQLQQAINELRQWCLQGCPSSSTFSRGIVTADPLQTDAGTIAFVFPGSGSGFPGMGRELLSAFPEVLERQDRENLYLKRQYCPERIWSRESFSELQLDHKTMIFSQVAIGTAVCDLLALFGVHPAASIGYSLGESSALFGLRAWTDRDDMLQRMERSELFGSDLVAPFNAARKAWNVPAEQPVRWISGVIDRSASDIHQAIERRRARAADSGTSARLYLLIINTPRQCVIGGDQSEVDGLVRELDAAFLPFASPSTVHCDVLRQVEQNYRELHLMRTTIPHVASGSQGRVTDQRPIRFYSTGWGHAYDLTAESAADAIVAQAVSTIDFPRVVEQAYADGVRMFVEVGPGSSCTKMIDEILGDRRHLACSALPMTSRPVEAFYDVLAALIVARIPVDLSYLYGQQSSLDDASAATKPRGIVTRVGGLPFQIPVPEIGWRFRPVAQTSMPLVTTMPEPTEQTTELAPGTIEKPASGSSASIPLTSATETILNSFYLAGNMPSRMPESVGAGNTPATHNVLDELLLMIDRRAQAHEAFLRFSERLEHIAAEHLALLAQAGTKSAERLTHPLNPPVVHSPSNHPQIPPAEFIPRSSSGAAGSNDCSGVQPDLIPDPLPQAIPDEPPTELTRAQCMEFAIGKIGRVLGRRFEEIDKYPTRVRLPDEPLMLVDRILEIDGEPLSMTSGRVVTEHDIHPGTWYLDCGRIPTCIAVEAGQADLFLSGWLGIDFQTKGVACYRLLDAVVTFHDALPCPGSTIHYDIRVLHFFRQGSTYLFRFEFDATVNGRPLLTMREGCAGFFTEQELAGGKGIIHTALDKRPQPGIRPADWSDPVPMAVESYDDSQVLALRRGDLESCFGPAFRDLPLVNPETLPGLKTLLDPNGTRSSGRLVPRNDRSRMWLIDRVQKLDPVGGKFGLGLIRGELDIHPDDWFLTCHFCDDQVMPGTLMYECCLHTLRIYLLRMGWIGEKGQIAYEPIPEIRSRLKCRGQVLASTKQVWYEVTLKEIGYGEPGSPREAQTPSSSNAYCVADALMYADGKPIVEITDMSVRLTGLTQAKVQGLWSRRSKPTIGIPAPAYDRRAAIFDTDRITAFAIGKPSVAFGDRYRVFDDERKIARLPGPPFQFLDRIVSIENCQPWVLQAGGEIVAQYDVPVDAWYFESNRQPTMPFAVLLETALQPCGWLAAYLGSALTSEIDVSFRNLGGTATQYRDVTPRSGTLTTTVKMSRVSNSAGMIIQHYDFDLRCDGESVYVGNTYFGFFSKAALSNQIGIRDAAVYEPVPDERQRAKRGAYPQSPPFPDDEFRMIQSIECLVPDGGPHGFGCIVGTMPVDPASWFFKAHFYQDPVVPGSLGLESFWQLLKVYAMDRWQLGTDVTFTTPSLVVGPASPIRPKHEWVYRGQVVPTDHMVTVTAVIRAVDDVRRLVTAEGFLSVDGRVIYQMKDFTLGVV